MVGMLCFLIIALNISLNLYSADSYTYEIRSIRTSFNRGKQRIVIDLDGKNETSFYVKKWGNILAIAIEARLDKLKAKELKNLLKKTPYIDHVQFVDLNDEGEVMINLHLSQDVLSSIFTLPSPSRVVIDMRN